MIVFQFWRHTSVSASAMFSAPDMEDDECRDQDGNGERADRYSSYRRCLKTVVVLRTSDT